MSGLSPDHRFTQTKFLQSVIGNRTGAGALTKKPDYNTGVDFRAVEIDREKVAYLKTSIHC
jgi:hypothetical protein